MDTSIEIHRPRWVKPIAAVAAVLVAAGGIGYAVTNDQGGDRADQATSAHAGSVAVGLESASPAPADATSETASTTILIVSSRSSSTGGR